MAGRREILPWLGCAALTSLSGAARAQAPEQIDPWPDLATQIFAGRRLRDGSAVVAIDAPTRAEDAAVVPVTLRSVLPSTDGRKLRALTLVIDQNPSPLALQVTLGPSGPDRLSTHVRVDSYTFMHLVAELSDGELYVTRRYVKAAGGCSAPAASAETGGIPLGTMRLRQFATSRSALLMIRHPNYSGMQMDQLTRLYVPAHFVSEVRVAADDSILFAATTGISIAENPEFRFPLPAATARVLRAEAHDNAGGDFKAEWPMSGSAGTAPAPVSASAG